MLFTISVGGVGQRDIHKRQTLCRWQEQPCKDGEECITTNKGYQWPLHTAGSLCQVCCQPFVEPSYSLKLHDLHNNISDAFISLILVLGHIEKRTINITQ